MSNKLTGRSARVIEGSISDIDRILSNNSVLSNSPHAVDSFGRLMICLQDLVKKSEKYARRIDFDDDVLKTSKRDSSGRKVHVRNVGDLIDFMRNAVGHPGANSAILESSTVSFLIVGGRRRNLIVVDGQDILPPCDYEDDVGIIFGYQRIYYKRHIIRAFEEAYKNLMPLIQKAKAEELAKFAARARPNQHND